MREHIVRAQQAFALEESEENIPPISEEQRKQAVEA